MLIQMLVHQPQMLRPIVSNTPTWVWGLLAALVALGLSQARSRQVSLARTTLLPVGMSALSLAATASSFSHAPHFGLVLLAWLSGATAAVVILAPCASSGDIRYDSTTRSFFLPGSWIPLLLILAIFVVRYAINVELAMQPSLATESSYGLVAGALYGFFSGVFAARALRLWRLAGGWHVASAGGARLWLQRDPW
jgi:hypothetical protein